MKPGALLLLVGSVALWTGLPAAPPRRTFGQPPISSSRAPGEAPQDKISQEEEARRAGVVAEEPRVAQKSPSSQGKESGGDREMGAEELQSGKEAAAPPGKLCCKENPQPERPPVNNLEAESSGGPRPTDGASGKDPFLGTQAQLAAAPGSSSLGSPQPALPSLEAWNPVWDPSSMATSDGKTNATKKPTSSTPGDNPPPGPGKPTPTEKPVPGSGHGLQDKPKPAPAAGYPMGPTTGEKPSPNSGPEAHGRPVTGEKPSSQEGHEKRPSADKPEHGEEPQAQEESKPEKEAEEGKKTEEAEAAEEEEGLFDDDGEEEEGEKGKETEEGTPEGNQDADDAFDKELDYGLNTSPLDAYSYHDAWSDEGPKEADLGLMGETAAVPQDGDANKDGEPIFDAWGDLVGGSRP